ncbi:MAG: DUF87 domain-containing protein [Acidobacteria bacterium]|nr:DUF87 domain-containing protein [Acidobacteriota bacterium]
MKLPIAKDLELPESVITQKLAFLGITGSGKTYAAGKLAELLLTAGAQVVILDCVGNWWSLRLAADGKGRGFDIPVLGGLKGDIPLEPTAGALVADVLVDRHISAVIDVSQLTSSEHYKFALAFATRLFQRRKERPAAMHLIIEEAQEFIPQNITDKGDEPKMLRAFERLWKLGRNFGIGGLLISQRPQEINKKVLNMSGTVFAFCMIGSQERDAVRAWLKSNMSGAEEITNTLPSLAVGHAHVFSPQFLQFNKVVKVLPKTTFDASATPDFKAGTRDTARPLSEIDLSEIKDAMALSVERAKADDPKLLRVEIAALKRQVTDLQKHSGQIAWKEIEAKCNEAARSARDQCQTEYEREREAYQERIRWYDEQIERIGEAMAEMHANIKKAAPRILVKGEPLKINPAHIAPHKSPLTDTLRKLNAKVVPISAAKPNASIATTNHLPSGERRVLIAIAQHRGGVSREQLTVLTGFRQSTRNTYIQRLRERRWVGMTVDRRIIATKEGEAALGDFFEPLPTGEALRLYWIDNLPGGEKQVFQTVIAAYPDSISREEIGNLTGYAQSSRNTYLQRLKARQLITNEGSGQIRAADELFDL